MLLFPAVTVTRVEGKQGGEGVQGGEAVQNGSSVRVCVVSTLKHAQTAMLPCPSAEYFTVKHLYAEFK